VVKRLDLEWKRPSGLNTVRARSERAVPAEAGR